jgi:hypothetical protein
MNLKKMLSRKEKGERSLPYGQQNVLYMMPVF